MIYNLFGFAEVRILPLFFVMTEFCYCRAFKLAYFVEHNKSYQLSRMSGSNFTKGEGVENTPSAVPGAKSPVLLGLNISQY